MRMEFNQGDGRRDPMRLFVHRASSFCIFIALLATTASAAPPDFRESSRWVPSLGVTSGLLVEQHAEGEVASTVRPRADGSNSLVAPWLGADLEGMTPAWEPLGGRIRFFVHGGIAGNLGFERDLAKEGAPGAFVEPDLPLFGDEELVRGQGSVTRVEPTGLQASAGIGVSFTLDTEWRRIRIKPSFEYLLEEVEISGVVHRAVSVDPSIPSFDLIAISGTEDRSFHGIGRRLPHPGRPRRRRLVDRCNGNRERDLAISQERLDLPRAGRATLPVGTESGPISVVHTGWNRGLGTLQIRFLRRGLSVPST
jgi:hypothetical protein